MLKIAFGATFALMAASAAYSQDTVTWRDNVNGWSVAVDRTIQDSCFILSDFGDDMYLRFQFNAVQQNVQFIVASTIWASLENGENYDLEVAFGNMDAWVGTAKGHRWNDILPSLVLSVPMEDHQAAHFMQEFTAMNSVRVTHEGSEIANLALTGAAEAVASMLDCQASMSKMQEMQKSEDDPFAPRPDPI